MIEENGTLKRVVRLESVDSTNSYSRRLLSLGEVLPDFTLVYADKQAEGRGQAGNSWESEPGKNIVFSIVCHPEHIAPSRQFILSQCISIAIQQALSQYTDGVCIKWPNDIYWHDKKLCGILIECDLAGKTIRNCVIGCGVNVNQRTFVSDAPNPVSLSMITGLEHDRDELLANIVRRFIDLYIQARDNDGAAERIARQYMRRLYRRGGKYMYKDRNGSFEAEIVGVESTGHLMLRLDTGETRRYEFKEVAFVL